MKNLEVILNLKWSDVLDELKWYIEVNNKFWLILQGKKYGFDSEKQLHNCMRKIREELNKDKIVFNL